MYPATFPTSRSDSSSSQPSGPRSTTEADVAARLRLHGCSEKTSGRTVAGRASADARVEDQEAPGARRREPSGDDGRPARGAARGSGAAGGAEGETPAAPPGPRVDRCLDALPGGDRFRRGRCDVSPKGDPAGNFLTLDERTVVLPERPG